MNACCSLEEVQQLSEHRATLIEQQKKTEFDPEPYERATVFLESLPYIEFVDERFQLAWDISLGTAPFIRPDLSRRALYSAVPAGSKLRDRQLERRWFTGAGLIEVVSGNVQLALKYKVVALKLCEELEDRLGFLAEWGNLALMASAAGLYQDALEYASVALKVRGISSEHLAEQYGPSCLNRANAHLRLGRLTEATADIALCLTTLPHPASGRRLFTLVMAQLLFCEIALERGDLSAANAALNAAKAGAECFSDAPHVKLQLRKYQLRLSTEESGSEAGILGLENLLNEALEVERLAGQASFDDLVLDILHSLERVCRDHGRSADADKWLSAIGRRLRSNATEMIVALSQDASLVNTLSIEAKLAEVDSYLSSKSITIPRSSNGASPSWSYLVGLAASASAAEDSSKEHGFRVARLACLVAQELGLSSTMQRGIQAGCLVHDVGKAAIPSSILLKQAALEPGELNLYNSHTVAGAEILQRAELSDRSIVENIVRFHHHRYEGGTESTSPKADAIPLEARIASVCDRYDSLVTGRPRRPRISSTNALREVFQHRSKDFDPTVVDAFVEVVRRLQRDHADVQAYLSEGAEAMEYFAMQRTISRAAKRALT